MKVLLLNPQYLSPDEMKGRYVRYRDWIETGNMYVHPFEPPLGLANLIAYLKKHGEKAGLIDLQALGMTDAELKARLKKSRPDLVGITAMTPTYPSALRLAKFVREALPKAKIVMGGVHPTIMPEPVFEEAPVDFVIRGEGERPMLALVQGKPPSDIDGLCYLKDGRPVTKAKAKGIDPLDELPMADYGAFPAERYIEYNRRLRGISGLSMLVSRGCPYHCAFCAVEGAMGRKYRIKEPAAAIDEMQALKEKFKIDGIWFKDSIFDLKRDWVKKFCKGLLARGLDMKWQMNTRVDLVDADMLSLMKEAGLVQVDLGIESGSQKTLDTLNKKITVEQIRNAVETAKRYVKVSGFFMIGVPGETEKDISDTFRLAKELDLDRYSFSIFVPLPGSDLYDMLLKEGKLAPNTKLGGIHFTDADKSYCEVPLARLREIFKEINDYFSCAVKKGACA
jgi:anaerobic magnesium-protoporphyrin IX monomethyl ester cyclase